MSTHYRITFKVEIPCPREFAYTEIATSPVAAVGRAFRKFKKDLPRKKIDRWKIDVMRA
jgi:hypothetical protein